MWFGLTIARSSPAATQWCRKTELRTARARGVDAEGDVGDAERRLDPRDVLLDAPDALDRLDRRRAPLLLAGRQRERQAVEDERLGVEAVLVAAQLLQALGDLELALGRLRHPDLVDRQRDQAGAVGERERHDAVGLVAAGLEVDRVDDRAAGDLLERGLDDLGLGRVDLDRRGLRERDALGDAAHLLVLVVALDQRDAEVEHVRAAVDLVLGDLVQAVVVVGQQHLLGLARALRVHALADHRRPRLLDERRRGDHRADVRPGAAPGAAWRARPFRPSASTRMWSGVVPQQPPTMLTP